MPRTSPGRSQRKDADLRSKNSLVCPFGFSNGNSTGEQTVTDARFIEPFLQGTKILGVVVRGGILEEPAKARNDLVGRARRVWKAISHFFVDGDQRHRHQG